MFAVAAALTLLGLTTSPAHALEDDFEFDLEGYYRVRGTFLPGMYADQKSDSLTDVFSAKNGDGRTMTQRLRLQPTLDYDGKAKFIMMADVLDDTVWGDNQSMASTALFAGNPTSTGTSGQQNDSLNLKRAWMEFTLPVGLVRVGRQPSNWGMGLLANGGDGFDDSFGENHGGSTYDRIIFATKPLAMAGAALKKDSWADIPLFFAIGVDRLVEDPLIQYYGYKCSIEDVYGDAIEEGHEEYDPRCDPDGQGYHALEHDLTEDRIDTQRQPDWWVDQDDDVMEVVYALIYKGEGITLGGHESDLVVGTYVVNRKQRETNSNILITDAYLRFLHRGIYLEGEVLHIGGESSAIALPGTYSPSGDVADPLYKEVDIWGYVGRVGYKQPKYDVIFETGFASGDDDPADQAFTGRSIHSDYNVGLLLYDEVLSRVTATTWTTDAKGLWSKGGVYNSRYIFPTATARLMDGNEIILGYLVAWPHKPDGSRILCKQGDKAGGEKIECSAYDAKDSAIGWEIDLAIKQRFANHMLFSLEGGFAQTTDRIPTENLGLNADGKFWTLQSRIAYEF